MSASTGIAASTALLVMGVSGSGKSTVGRRLASRLSWPFVEADDLHPPLNIAKMTAGIPLTDADRAPWLRLVLDLVDDLETDVVVTCSALRRSYRDVLRTGRADVRIVHLVGAPDLLSTRLAGRAGHFMPPSLLTSQIETLEPLDPDEDGILLDVEHSPDRLVDAAVAALRLPADRHRPSPSAA